MPKRKTKISDLIAKGIEQSKFGYSLNDAEVWEEIYKKHPKLRKR